MQTTPHSNGEKEEVNAVEPKQTPKQELIVPPDLEALAMEAQKANQLARKATYMACAYALVSGKILAEAKDEVDRRNLKGGYRQWLKDHEIAKTTAFRYVELVKRLSPAQYHMIPMKAEDLKLTDFEKLKLPAAGLTALYQEMGIVKKPAAKKPSEKPTDPKTPLQEEAGKIVTGKDPCNAQAAVAQLVDVSTWFSRMGKNLSVEDIAKIEQHALVIVRQCGAFKKEVGPKK
jgi:hypothetical protein